MQEWIVKLNVIDGDAASALRVIEHFDTLIDRKASALAMLRAAAALAACPVGLEDPERGLCIAVDANGRAVAASGGPPADGQVERFEEITVWLDREVPPRPLDRLILERFARSLHGVKKSGSTGPKVTGLRIVCDPGSSETERQVALRQLGLGAAVTVVVTHFADAGSLPPGLVVDGHQIHLLPTPMPSDAVSASVAAGIVVCAGLEVCHMWPRARTALRVAVDPATAGPMHMRYDQLGSVAAVAESVDAVTASKVDDIRRLDQLRSQRPWVVSVLDTVVTHSSIRDAARRQNLHHSTLRQRIDWLERQLGYPLRTPAGYARAGATLILWRIATAGQALPSPAPSAAHPPNVGDLGDLHAMWRL